MGASLPTKKGLMWALPLCMCCAREKHRSGVDGWHALSKLRPTPRVCHGIGPVSQHWSRKRGASASHRSAVSLHVTNRIHSLSHVDTGFILNSTAIHSFVPASARSLLPFPALCRPLQPPPPSRQPALFHPLSTPQCRRQTLPSCSCLRTTSSSHCSSGSAQSRSISRPTRKMSRYPGRSTRSAQASNPSSRKSKTHRTSTSPFCNAPYIRKYLHRLVLNVIGSLHPSGD